MRNERGEQESAGRASDCSAAVRKSQNKDRPVEDTVGQEWLSSSAHRLCSLVGTAQEEHGFCMNHRSSRCHGWSSPEQMSSHILSENPVILDHRSCFLVEFSNISSPSAHSHHGLPSVLWSVLLMPTLHSGSSHTIILAFSKSALEEKAHLLPLSQMCFPF